MVADALKREGLHQSSEQVWRIAGLYRAPKQTGLRVVGTTDQPINPGDAANRTDEFGCSV